MKKTDVITSKVRALLTCALLSAAVVGCSSGTDVPDAAQPSVRPSLPAFGSNGEPDVPASFRMYDGGAYSFSYPQDWKLVERAGRDGPIVVVEGPVTPAGLPQQFTVATQENYTGDLDLVVNAFEFLRKEPAQELVRDERVLFAERVEAQVTERTYDAPTQAGQVRSRKRELRLVTPERLLVLTSARTSDAHFAASPLPAVFDSFRLAQA